MNKQHPHPDFLSEFMGREKETETLKQYLNECIESRGKTIIVSGETGVGKTRLINEFMNYAMDKNIQCLTGESTSQVSAPCLPFILALQDKLKTGLMPSYEEKTVNVEEFFLINNAGIVISYTSQKERTIDKDVVGGMLTAVQDFVKDSFQDKGPVSGLGRLDYGKSKILIEHCPTIFAAAVTKYETREIRNDLRAVVNAVEEKYGEILKKWDGNTTKLTGIEKLIQPLIVKQYPIEERKDPRILDAEKIKMYEQVLQTIQKTAEEKPLLLFLDGLQWADESSLKLLHYISRNTQRNRIIIIGAYRPEDKTRVLDETLHEMGMEQLFTNINIGCLSKNDTTKIISSIFPHIGITEGATKRIYQETGGNPFFLQALLQGLHENGDIYKSEEKWVMRRIGEINIPTNIKDAVLRRFDRLNTEQKKILQYASAIGEQFDFITLQKITGINDEQLVDQVEQLLRLRLIKEISGRVGMYRFDNSKTQEIIYEELSDMKKKIVNQKIAETIEEEYKDKTGEITDRLALYYRKALNYEKAVKYAEISGEKCELSFSPEEAIIYYKIALDCLEKLESTGLNQTRKMRMVDKIGYMYYLLGEWDTSLDYTNMAMKLGIETKSQAQIAESYRNMGIIQTNKAEYEYALSNLRNALKISEDIHDITGIAESYYNIGRINWRTGKLDEALHNLTQCLTFCESSDNKSLMAKTLMDIGVIYNTRGEYEKSMEMTMKSISISEELDNKYELARAYNGMGVTYDWMGNISQAIDWWEKSIKICGEIAFVRGLGYGLSNLSEAHAKKEELDKAEEYTYRAKEIFERLRERKMIAAMHRNYGIILSGKKEWSKSKSHFEEGIRIAREVDDFESLPQIYFEYGKMYKAKGDKEEAKEQFKKTIEIYEKIGNKEKVEEVKQETKNL